MSTFIRRHLVCSNCGDEYDFATSHEAVDIIESQHAELDRLRAVEKAALYVIEAARDVAFAQCSCYIDPRERRLLVHDKDCEILTTDATLRAAHAALREEGAEE